MGVLDSDLVAACNAMLHIRAMLATALQASKSKTDSIGVVCTASFHKATRIHALIDPSNPDRAAMQALV